MPDDKKTDVKKEKKIVNGAAIVPGKKGFQPTKPKEYRGFLKG